MSNNPYRAPYKSSSSERSHGSSNGLPAATDMLRQTRPWVRIISIIIYLMAGLMILVGIVLLTQTFILGVIYLVMAAIYLAPAILLWSYAAKISQLLNAPSEQTLVAALKAQKSFWMFVAITIMVILGIYILLLLFMLASTQFMDTF